MISKKTKNIIIRTICAIVVIGTSTIGFSSPVKVKAEDTKVKNVILLVADGMSDSVLTASKYYNDIQDGTLGNDNLAMDSIRTGYVKTCWANGPITDSAPAATALSSGYKTNPGVIGMDTSNKPKATVLEAAELNGLATGIVSTCETMHATPGGFSAHAESRSNYNAIMKQEVYQDMEVVLGGGKTFFGATGGEKRKDNKDLVGDIKSLGYDYVTTKADMKASKSNKLWGLFADTAMAYDFDRQALDNKEEPRLRDMTEKAVDVLDNNEKGFFLMVEGSKIDWAAHANDPAGTIGDIMAFDQAVEYSVNYAKENQDTIVIVTTDHANSGFSIGNEDTTSGYDNLTFEDSINQLKGYSLSAEKFNELIKDKSNEEIAGMITKYYGYKNITEEEIGQAKAGQVNLVMEKRAKIGYTTGGHTGGDVYLGVYAPSGVKRLKGVIDNTDIPKYIASNLSISLDNASDKLFQNISSVSNEEGFKLSVNKDDADNPYALLQKDDLKVDIMANSNLVKVYKDGIEKKAYTLEGVTVINGSDEVFTSESQIEQILKEAKDIKDEPTSTPTPTESPTGDSTQIFFVGSTALLSVGYLLVSYKKKRQ